MLDAWSNGIGFYSFDANPAQGFNNAIQMNHIPGGSNVLYMDGHAEYRKLGDFPIFVGNPNTYAMPRGASDPVAQFELASIMSIAGGAL